MLHVLYYKAATKPRRGAITSPFSSNIPHPLGFVSFGYYSGSLGPTWTKLATSNTCSSYNAQHKVESIQIQQPEPWHPAIFFPKYLSGAHQSWSTSSLSSPSEGMEKNTQLNTRSFFLNAFGIPGYIALKRRLPTTDPSIYLQLRGYISGTGRWAGGLGRVHRQVCGVGAAPPPESATHLSPTSIESNTKHIVLSASKSEKWWRKALVCGYFPSSVQSNRWHHREIDLNHTPLTILASVPHMGM